jgi:hypothetical protein
MVMRNEKVSDGTTVVAGPRNSAQAELRQMIQLLLPFAIRGLATLGVADVLADGPASVETNADALYRTIRYTASRGVFKELPNRVFDLTPTAEYLRSDVAGSMRAMLTIDDSTYGRLRVFTEVVHTLRTGESGYQKVRGSGPMDKAPDGQSPAPRYHRLGNPQKWINKFIDVTDFSTDHSVTDIGGGNGMLLGTILARHPLLTGVLLELPYTMEEASSVLGGLGVAERCELVSGDMFEAVPAGTDTYLMSSVVHNWANEKAHTVLANVRAAMGDDGRLLIIESLISTDGPQSDSIVRLDFMNLLNGGGRERTADEHRELLDQAGLRLVGVTPIGDGFTVLEARPK